MPPIPKKRGNKPPTPKAAPAKKPAPAKRTPAQKGPPKKVESRADMLLGLASNLSTKVKGAQSFLLSDDNFDQLWSRPTYYVSTRSLAVDRQLGLPGLPGGRLVEVYGENGCLDEDSFIRYEVREPDGRTQNSKGGTIRRLYERFHGMVRGGKGYYQRPSTIGSVFLAPSIDEDGRVFMNRVDDVIRSGRKLCRSFLTEVGWITATDDHRFWIGDRFVLAEQLEVGSVVHVHNKTPFDEGGDGEGERRYLYVKAHPVAGAKNVKDRSTGKLYEYRRLARARAVVEAAMNGLPFDRYVQLLNDAALDGLRFLTKDQHVHHKDENRENDDLTNLEVTTNEEHGRHHAVERHFGRRYVSVPVEILEIKNAGERETYDVKMAAPFHNFVADGYVVHNSGKSSLIDQILAETQAMSGVACLIDAEEARDLSYMGRLGVNTEEMIVSQATMMEDVFSLVRELAVTARAKVGPGVPITIAWDSVAGTPTREEYEAPNDQFRASAAKVLRQQCRTTMSTIAREQVLFICANQIYNKMSSGPRKFFSDQDETYGGGAIKYHASIRLAIFKKRNINPRGYEYKEGEPIADPIGQDVGVKTVKNKLAAPNKYRTIHLLYGQGFDNRFTVFEDFCTAGLITLSGSWYRLDKMFGDFKPWQSDKGEGLWGLADLIASEPGLWAALIQEYKARFAPGAA